MLKQRVLIISIVILVVINLAMMSFMWFTREGKGPRIRRLSSEKRTERVLEKRLKLNEDQLVQFKEAREMHFEMTNPLIESIHDNRVKLNSREAFRLSKTEVENITESIGKLTTELEQYNFTHIQKLRSICNEEQKKKFDMLISKMVEQGRGPKIRKKRRSRRHGN